MRSLNDHIFEHVQSEHLIALIIVALLSTTIYFLVPHDDGEQPVHFIVPIPEQSKPDWQGEILENPSIKVQYIKVSTLLHIQTKWVSIGSRVKLNSMLLSSKWCFTWPCKSSHRRWN